MVGAFYVDIIQLEAVKVAPLYAVNFAQVVTPIAIGAAQPCVGMFTGSRVVGICVPYFTVEVAELLGGGCAPEESNKFAFDAFPCKSFGGRCGESVLKIKAKVSTGNHPSIDPCTVLGNFTSVEGGCE